MYRLEGLLEVRESPNKYFQKYVHYNNVNKRLQGKSTVQDEFMLVIENPIMFDTLSSQKKSEYIFVDTKAVADSLCTLFAKEINLAFLKPPFCWQEYFDVEFSRKLFFKENITIRSGFISLWEEHNFPCDILPIYTKRTKVGDYFFKPSKTCDFVYDNATQSHFFTKKLFQTSFNPQTYVSTKAHLL